MKKILCFWLTLLMLFVAFEPALAEDESDKIEVTVVYGDNRLRLENCRPDRKFTVIHAVYKTDGALQSIETQEADLDGSYSAVVDIAEPYSTRSRIFLWESMEGMVPVDYVLNVSGEPYEPTEPTPFIPTTAPVSTPAPTPIVPTPAPTPIPLPTPEPTECDVLIAEPLEEDNRAAEARLASSTLIQSFAEYADGQASSQGTSVSGTNIVYNYNGNNKELFNTVKRYASLLGSGSMNFELASENVMELSNGYVFDYHFKYTGTASGMSGDVIIYGTFRYGEALVMSVTVPPAAEAADLGYREDGSFIIPAPAGESAMAGVYKRIDGSFETTDGRLKTTLGHAMVLYNGASLTADAEYAIYTDKKETLYVTGYSGSDTLYFRMPYKYALSGDLYKLEDLKGDHSVYQKYNWGPDSYSPGASLFAETVWLNSKNQWIYPQYDASKSYFDDLTVRVMYYERGNYAVFYIYSDQQVSPYSIEALCAVDMNVPEITPEPSGGGSSSVGNEEHDCVTCHGSGDCPKCHGTGLMTRYAAGGGTVITTCSTCGGSKKCYACGGSGRR